MSRPESDLPGRDSAACAADSFLADPGAYGEWRARKLADRAREAVPIPVADPRAPKARALAGLREACARHNFALYRMPGTPGPGELLAFARTLGLRRLDRNPLSPLDGVAVITAKEAGARRDFIPYTDRALNWHTDGYYNEDGREVRGVIMHCAAPAAAGGESTLIDPEIAYLRLRDADPALARALWAPDVLTVPAWVEDGRELRPARRGPVFSLHEGALHMRYTIRKRHVCWKDVPVVREARAFLEAWLAEPGADAVRVRLGAGEGIVCNNVLHRRDAYRDPAPPAPPRTLLRARFLDRVGEAPCSA